MAVRITVKIDLDVEVTETPMTLLNRLMGVLLTRKFAIGSRIWQYGSLDWWINFAEGKTSSIPPIALVDAPYDLNEIREEPPFAPKQVKIKLSPRLIKKTLPNRRADAHDNSDGDDDEDVAVISSRRRGAPKRPVVSPRKGRARCPTTLAAFDEREKSGKPKVLSPRSWLGPQPSCHSWE